MGETHFSVLFKSNMEKLQIIIDIHTSKKLFQEITRVNVSTVDHVVRISCICCDNFSWFLDPKESIEDN